MAAVLPNTSVKLDTARSSLGAAQARLDRLVGERAAAVAGDADIEAVRKIDREIEAARGEIIAYGERITSLEARLADEERTRRAAEHRAAVDKFGKLLPPIAMAAEEIEGAIRSLAGAVNRYQRAAAVAAAAWPPETVSWNSDHLAGGRVGELLQECLAPGGLCRRRGSEVVPGPDAREFTDMARTADQRIAGFAVGERRHHDELMKDLRSQPAPEPEPALDDAA